MRDYLLPPLTYLMQRVSGKAHVARWLHPAIIKENSNVQ
jgi:hypothetical protein